MTVYVDDAYIPYGRMKMCHMITDGDLSELHSMAEKIGVERKYFQNKRIPHYDISMSKRKLAVENGTREVSERRLIEIIREKKWTLQN